MSIPHPLAFIAARQVTARPVRRKSRPLSRRWSAARADRALPVEGGEFAAAEMARRFARRT